MANIKNNVALVLLFTLFFITCGVVHAVPPDFNADRRVNIRCPATIQSDNGDKFETDGLMTTLKRLYHELDDNLKASYREGEEGKYGQGYGFSSDPNEGIFYVTHAKAAFPAGKQQIYVLSDCVHTTAVLKALPRQPSLLRRPPAPGSGLGE